MVLEAPPDTIFRDIQSVFRAVDGGWKSVNGYSGWGPSYYNALVGAGRAEADALLTPFQQLGELYVLVDQAAPRVRDADRAATRRHTCGQRRARSSSTVCLGVRSARSPFRRASVSGRASCDRRVHPDSCRRPSMTTRHRCGSASSGTSVRLLTADLGDVRTVGSVVNNLGSFSWLFPGALVVETSEDGTSVEHRVGRDGARSDDSCGHGRSETSAHRGGVSASPSALHPPAGGVGRRRGAVDDRRAGSVVVVR